MSHVRAGLLTSYGADLTQPAWLYVVARSLDHPARIGWLRRTLGYSPETAAAGLFLGATLTEFSQLIWPHGLFNGVFDPRDLAAYAAGLLLCYLVERKQLRDQAALQVT
jgi:hypothetical protein